MKFCRSCLVDCNVRLCIQYTILVFCARFVGDLYVICWGFGCLSDYFFGFFLGECLFFCISLHIRGSCVELAMRMIILK
jgi:hypothetical protein